MVAIKPKRKRKRKLNPDPHARALGLRGGAARTKAMTPEERSAVARLGGEATRARWQRIREEQESASDG